MVRISPVFLSFAFFSQPCAAQDTVVELPGGTQQAVPPEIVIADYLADESFTILVNGLTERRSSTGAPISVFGRAEIEDVQGPDLMRLVERAPGVSASSNGGPGSFTAVRVRGAEGEQLLVLIDGVRVADPAAPGGGFDFGNLLMGSLAKVELQRSSNSTIWGSQALGGVLAVTTGGGNDNLTGSVEYGTHDSFYATAAADLARGPASLGLQAARFSSDGFSAAAAGTEPDGFRQTELVGRATVELGGGLSAFARGRYADGRLDIDGFPAPAYILADTAEYQDSRQRSGAVGLRLEQDNLDLSAAASLADTERDSFDPTLGAEPSYTTDGTSERAELRGRWRFADGLAIDFGGEREWTRFSTSSDPQHRTAIGGGYAQLGYDHGSLHLAAGLRRDEHRDFGGEWSLGADAGWQFAYGWRATASYGEGFKAPTLFQLHSDFGNAALQPERSRSYDLGLGYYGSYASFKLTAFRRDTRDLIGFVSCFGQVTGICENRPFGTYDNIGRARAQGVEVEGGFRPVDDLGLSAAYAYIEAEDRTPGSAAEGNDLARRPRHALTGTVEWQAVPVLTLAADLRVVSNSYDDAANAVEMDGYEVLTLRASWDVSDNVALFGRVENAWDEHYETAAGYATEGRAAHVGARARF